MKINIGNRIIASTDFSSFETAWRIEDAVLVLEYFRSNNKIVLGGDILTKNLKHTYDSWYYNVESNQLPKFSIDNSIKMASDYIAEYVRVNGNAFYVIFVVK